MNDMKGFEHGGFTGEWARQHAEMETVLADRQQSDEDPKIVISRETREAISGFLEGKLRVFEEKYSQNMGFGDMSEGTREVLKNGEVELSNGDFLGRNKVYIDKGSDISKIVWYYRRKGECLSDGEVSENQAYKLILREIGQF